MVTATLVSEDMAEGAKLLEELDRAGVEVPTALWFYFSESDAWRLILATPQADGKDSLKTSLRVYEIQRAAGLLPYSDVSVRGLRDHLVKRLRKKPNPKWPPRRRLLHKEWIGEEYTDAAYIYRLS